MDVKSEFDLQLLRTISMLSREIEEMKAEIDRQREAQVRVELRLSLVEEAQKEWEKWQKETEAQWDDFARQLNGWSQFFGVQSKKLEGFLSRLSAWLPEEE